MTQEEISQLREIIREELAPLKSQLIEQGRQLDEQGVAINTIIKWFKSLQLRLTEITKTMQKHANTLTFVGRVADLLNRSQNIDTKSQKNKNKIEKLKEKIEMSSKSEI